MYQFSGKLKITSIVLIILGLAFTAISFMSAPKTLDDAKAILASQNVHHQVDVHNVAHQGSHTSKTIVKHDNHSDKLSDESHTDKKVEVKDSVHTQVASHENEVKKAVKEHHDTISSHADNIKHEVSESLKLNTHYNDDHKNADASHENHKVAHEVTNEHEVSHKENATVHHDAEAHGADHHAEHVFHQMQNRPVAAFYVAMLFFLGITLLVLAFYAAQRVANAGWSVVIFRVMEAITNNLHYVSIAMLLFIIGTVLHKFHLFPWMKEGTFDPQSPNFDPVVNAKKWFMNIPGWTIRSIIYLIGWNVFRFIIRKKSVQQDNGDLKLHKNIYNICVGFIVFFLVSESMMSWDWIMGIDPHWFSTLFGWYVLATFLVCALTVVAMVTIYLRSKGNLPSVNDSHIHDLAKFMFGFSVFWTYLWFAQFMLIWYADMPEETTYFLQRFNEYKVPFLVMVALNFVFPVLILLNSDFKSMPWFVLIAGSIILAGHYIDLFVMVMPGTVGGQWGFGLGEIGGLFLFTGIFIFATFSAFAKVDPVPKGNPYLHESETFHYYNIIHRGEDDNSGH